jgi:tetratricopeptide (TPR) repeat protein
MRYMKGLSLGMVGFAFAATMVFGQGNQEAANLTREGIEASKAKDWDKAITAFRKAAQLEERYAPNLASALQQRATIYVSQKKFQEAIADYSEALKVKSNDPDVYERRGYAEMQMKDYDKALHDYNEAIKLSPEEPKYYQVRAIIYQDKGDFKAALADTEKTLKLDPNNADAQSRKRFLDAKLHGTPTPVPMPSGPIRNPNVPPAAAAGGTPAPGKP